MLVELRVSSLRQALQRALFHFRAPLVLSFFLSLPAVILGGDIKLVLVTAIEGQLAVPLIKLLFYATVILVSLACVFTTENWAKTASLWIAQPLTSVTFDYSCFAMGVMLGVGPALWVEQGFVRGTFLSLNGAFAFAVIAGVAWLGVWVAGGGLRDALKDIPWLQSLAAGAICVSVFWTFQLPTKSIAG